MSDRDMWPNERDSTAEQWAAPPTGPEGQPGGPHGAPSYGGQSNPGTSYGAQGSPGTSYGPQGDHRPGYADPGYADPSYADQGQRGPDYGSVAGPQAPEPGRLGPTRLPTVSRLTASPATGRRPTGHLRMAAPRTASHLTGPGRPRPTALTGTARARAAPVRYCRGVPVPRSTFGGSSASDRGRAGRRRCGPRPTAWCRSASTAAPAVTTPSGGAGSGTGSSGNPSSGNPFVYPFGGTGGTGSGVGSSSEGAGGPSDASAIAAKVDPALVDVNVTFNYQLAEGAGTGIVLSSNGLVLTNNHVIDEATKISVTDVGNGKTYPATVVGYDNRHDVALLQLQGASGLTAAKLSTSAASVGEAVVAIGNAGGAGGTPTSAGGLRHRPRSVHLRFRRAHPTLRAALGPYRGERQRRIRRLPGPLVNASGQVVGMDTAASRAFLLDPGQPRLRHPDWLRHEPRQADRGGQGWWQCPRRPDGVSRPPASGRRVRPASHRSGGPLRSVVHRSPAVPVAAPPPRRARSQPGGSGCAGCQSGHSRRRHDHEFQRQESDYGRGPDPTARGLSPRPESNPRLGTSTGQSHTATVTLASGPRHNR